jgi:protein phosphatase 1 regulatory subunit 3A/B/C/D/E
MDEYFNNCISINNCNSLNNYNYKINNCEYSLKWKQCFEQPAIKPDFFKNLNEKKVSLETIHLKSHLICGVVRVLNICFNKNVKIRYTTDKWKTFEDVNAAYINNSCDGHTDRFSFNLNLENNLVKFFNNSQNFYNKYNIEFAIAYETSKATTSENECYWDNNYGSNYIIECLNNSSSTQIKNINEILSDLSNNLTAAFV